MDERECAFRQNVERDAARPRGARLAHQRAIAAVCVSRLPVLLLSGTTSIVPIATTVSGSVIFAPT